MATDNGNGTVTVAKGDTLYAIAKKYYSTYGYSSASTYQKYLVELNGIPNANLIYVGQVIKLTSNGGESSSGGSGSSSSTSTKNNTSSMVKVTHFGLLASGSDSLFVAWKWDKENTKEYRVRWFRSWDLLGIAPYEERTVTQNYDTYTPPSEVINSANGKVSVSIMPISESKDNKLADGSTITVHYWYANWSTVNDSVRYYYGNRAPTDSPSAPTVEIEDSRLTASLDDVPDEIPFVEFQVCKMSDGIVVNEQWKVGTSDIHANTASYSWTIELGYEYKVRCRYVNENGGGGWSTWSGGSGTKPSAPSGIKTCRAVSETEVYLEWHAATNADSYEIEYSTNKDYFDSSSDVRSIASITNTSYFITGLESGDEYFFRVRAVNSNGESSWTAATSIVIGTEPAAPTTWSSTTTVVSGEELTLYWVHNSEDGSKQSEAEVELTINGNTSTKTIVDLSSDEDDEKTMHYTVDTSGYTEGVIILWRVRTAGATGVYGDWSIQRTVTVYAQPTLSISIPSTLESFPLDITGDAGPNTQTSVGYHVSVISNSYYETFDSIGNVMIVNEGDEVYSKYIDTSEQLAISLLAGDLDLENNVTYTVTVVVSMNSGLTATDSRSFTVAWTDELYEPNAEIGYNKNTYTMTIRPFCKDENESLVDNVILSVYRREFDGGFTEIATGLKNSKQTYVTDPHPALDFARYRIVAISEDTGAVSYCDLPGYPIGESAIIIQWDDAWRSFDSDDALQTKPVWSGSLLRLPYNIDVSEEFNTDVSLVEYIGREHPVSYYGTQRGVTSTWNVEIPKSDKETLYGIRRLALWMGNVYVREPSGTGYWARIKPSFNQKHLAVVIPITLSITRVEGGA